jgi:Na+-transporting methylmalonyl-CoA/oxaloacetate decarboxylase beta subunit
MTSDTQRYAADKNAEIEKDELKIINKLDTKEKVYKGSLIALCVLALLLTALFVPKAEIVIPVLSLIIGLLFKSSTLSDFFSHSKGKYNNDPNGE